MDYRELVRRECPDMEAIACETAAEAFFRKELLTKGPDPDMEYSIEDFRNLPEGLRAELVDGKLIYLEAPSTLHQEIKGEMHIAVANHIRSKGGRCKVYIPPFDVYISGDDSKVLEPDLTVVCDRSKLGKKGCHGAPDWIVEVTSPSTRRRDLGTKLFLYREAGVREYWIINPENRTVIVYVFETGEDASFYAFDESIPCHVFPDLKIRLSDVV